MTHVTASAETLPFAPDTFDLVLYLETVEHIEKPSAAGGEISRVLRPGGVCYITTPSRLRHLLSPDPHYQIPALLLLPDFLQALLFRWLRRSVPYEVNHIYWTVRGIMNTMPNLELVEVTSRNAWARGPLRNIDWDWIIARKPAA